MSWIKRKSRNRNGSTKQTYSFSILMSWLFLAVSIALLVYTYFRIEILPLGNNNTGYFKYYLVSLVGIFFWSIMLLLREGTRANIITVTISLVVGLYMIEGGLIFLKEDQSNSRSSAAVKLGVEYDQRTRLEVIDGLIAQGVDAVPIVTPNYVPNMGALGGVSNRITVGSNETGSFMIYLSDRYGFNNPDSEWDAQNVEWFLTGDSFTEGASVQPGQDIAGQIRAITQKSVITVGRSGNGPLVELAELKEYAEAVEPKKVLWIYFEGNDLVDDLRKEKINPLFMRYMDDGFSQSLVNRQKELDSRLEKYIASAKVQQELNRNFNVIASKPHWVQLPAIRQVININGGGVAADPLFAKILTKAKSRVEAWGGKLYFVYLPQYERYSNITISHDKYRKKAEVIDLVKGLNIRVIDIHQEVLADHADRLSLYPFRLSGHHNAEGYKEIANAIVTRVEKYELD